VGEVDERGAWCRRLRDLINAHVSDLGGQDMVSSAEMILVRRAAMLCLQLEMMESRLAQSGGEASAKQIETYQRVTGAAEIRGHIAAMKGNKLGFLNQHTTDPRVASAVLGAPPFLSGLTDAEIALVQRQVEQHMEGRTVVANHVGHTTPHFGHWSLFIKYENTQSVCSHHHLLLSSRKEEAVRVH
jgi:hypothetical protein